MPTRTLVADGGGDAHDLDVHRRDAPAAHEQAGVRPDGRHMGTPDLLDVEAGVYGEYDSELHLDGKRRLKDLVREESSGARSRAVVMVTASVATRSPTGSSPPTNAPSR